MAHRRLQNFGKAPMTYVYEAFNIDPTKSTNVPMVGDGHNNVYQASKHPHPCIVGTCMWRCKSVD